MSIHDRRESVPVEDQQTGSLENLDDSQTMAGTSGSGKSTRTPEATSGLLGGFLGRKKQTSPSVTRASSVTRSSSPRSRAVLEQDVVGGGNEFYVKRVHLTKGGKAVSALSDEILDKNNVE